MSEPYLFGRNLTGRAGLFNDQIKQDSLSINKSGFDLGIGFKAGKDYYHRVGYELSQSKPLKNQNGNIYYGENGAQILTSAVSYVVGQDRLDNRYDPSEEHFSSLGRNSPVSVEMRSFIR